MIGQVRRSFDRGCELIATGKKTVGLLPGDIQIVPAFSFRGGEIRSEASEYFGLYAMAYALKWCRNASNFLAAAQAISAHHLYSSVVLLAYASAFHSLHAYLSLHGCVFVDPARDEDDSTEVRRTVVARLTKELAWKFEGARRGHQLRWNELRHVWRHSSAPQAFRDLFSYFYSDRWKVAPTLDWLVAKSGGRRSGREPVRWQFEEKVDEFLVEIARVRHEAQYIGFGADPSAWDAMINDKYGTARYPLHLRAEAMTSFAVSLAEDVAAILAEALQSVSVSKEALDGFRLLTFFPVQDSWRSAPLSDGLRSKLEELDILLGKDTA